MDLRPVLLVLSGIPGAGKTTLARAISEAKTHSEHICFDAGMQGEFSPEKWREAQACFYGRVTDAINRQVRLVIVDDNLNYLSMVKKYCRLARAHGYAVLHVVLRVAVETAVRRNRGRPVPVPEEIVVAMHRQLEKQRFLPSSVEVQEADVDTLADTVRRAVDERRTEAVQTEETEERQGRDSGEEPLHRADLRLRALIADRVQSCEHRERAGVAKTLARVKAEILQALRKETVLSVAEAEDHASLLFTSLFLSSYTELR